MDSLYLFYLSNWSRFLLYCTKKQNAWLLLQEWLSTTLIIDYTSIWAGQKKKLLREWFLKKESHRDISFPPLLYVPSLYQLCKYSKLNYIAKSVKISTADWVLSLKKIFFWVQNIVIECAIESINWDWDERIIV